MQAHVPQQVELSEPSRLMANRLPRMVAWTLLCRLESLVQRLPAGRHGILGVEAQGWSVACTYARHAGGILVTQLTATPPHQGWKH